MIISKILIIRICYIKFPGKNFLNHIIIIVDIKLTVPRDSRFKTLVRKASF